MKQYKIEDMMKLASELAKRTFIRDEVNVEWTYTSQEDPICGRRRFARIVWRKLNELVHRVNRDLETENLSWDSVAVTVQGWNSDKVHVTNVRAWMQMWFGNNLYLLTQKEGKLYITSSDMGTFPVKMPLDRLREMLTAFDAYLATDIHSVVTSALTACHAQVKANELLTTAALSLIHDLLQGKDLKIAMRQHRDRMYCEVKESEWWGTKRTFRTSLETFREDFAVACIRAGMSINLRSKNMELLQTAAIKRPVYEIFGKASFLDDVDICPVLRGQKPTLDSLRFDGDLEKMFDLKSKRWNFHRISLLQSKGFARMQIVHTPALLYLLSFTSVSTTNSLIIPIEGEPVKFTAVRFEVDEAIAGYDRNEEHRYANICVKLTSEDKKVILLLDAMKTDFSNFHLRFLLELCIALGFSPQSSDLKPFVGDNYPLVEKIIHSDFARTMLIPLNGQTRNQLAEDILRYIEFHTESTLSINSLKVLRELFI
jgi:hypothetical protein